MDLWMSFNSRGYSLRKSAKVWLNKYSIKEMPSQPWQNWLEEGAAVQNSAEDVEQ